MSAYVAGAATGRPPSVRRAKMEFWDGLEEAFMMPSISQEERAAIWAAVAAHVEDRLSLLKGVRIPTLGTFDAFPKRIQVGDETVTIRKPGFRLARNLAYVHNLLTNKAYLPGNKELEPLKYSKVAAAASVSRRKAELCIQGTTSLLSYCLGKGENVALVLPDVGVLLIEGTKVEMKFYYAFLARLVGKEDLEKVVLKVPWLLDMVVSPMVSVASLTFSGRVIVFPEFEMEFVARAFLKTSRQVPGEDKQTRGEALPPLGQDGKVPAGSLGFPPPASPKSSRSEIPPFWEITGTGQRKTPPVRRRSMTRRCSSAKTRPAAGQLKGKFMAKGQEATQSQAQAAKPRSYGGERGGGRRGGGGRGGRGEGRGGGRGGAGGGEGGRGEGRGGAEGGRGGRGGGGRGEEEEEGGLLAEKILAEIAAMEPVKAKPSSRPQEAFTFVTPVIAILSATSSEASLPEAYEALKRPTARPRWQKW